MLRMSAFLSVKRPRSSKSRVGNVKVEKQDDGGLGIESRQSDNANPDGDAQVVVEKIQQPDRSGKRKGHTQKNQDGLNSRVQYSGR